MPLTALLEKAGVRDFTKVSFTSVDGYVSSFRREEVAAHLVIVATLGNGVPLPRAQGYPARVVAEDVFGSRWVKYLERDLSALAKPGGPGAFRLIIHSFLFSEFFISSSCDSMVAMSFVGSLQAKSWHT